MYAVIVLYFVHYEDAFYGTEHFDGAEDVQHKLLVILHVGSVDFQQVVETAGDVVAFRHFGDVSDNVAELVGYFAVDAFHLDVAEHHESLVKFVGIDDGDVFFDVSFAFQPLQAFKDGGGGEVYAGGQFLGGESGVLLQGAENLKIGFV